MAAKKKAAGKYALILPQLKKAEPEDPGYQEKVEEAKRKITTRDAVKLAEDYIFFRSKKEEINRTLYAINLMLAAYEQLLDDSQERQAAGWGDYGVSDNSIKLATGALIRVQREPQAKILDKEAYRLWCINNEYERQMHLAWATTNSIVKERLVAGLPAPDGCEANSFTKVYYTKGDEQHGGQQEND